MDYQPTEEDKQIGLDLIRMTDEWEQSGQTEEPRDVLIKMINDGEVELDVKGHYSGMDRPTILEYALKELNLLNQYGEFGRMLLSGEGTYTIEGSCLNACGMCGEHVHLVFEGKTLTATTDCPITQTDFTFELNVPSGKMAVGNDFRPEFDITGDFNINQFIGIRKTSLAMAGCGCAYGYVGNTCPTVFKVGEDEFIIGSFYSEIQEPPGERVAGIITDLWWYSITDLDEFERRFEGKQKPDHEVIDVSPGVYEFRYLYDNIRADDLSKLAVYTEIRKVRGPDPTVDYMSINQSRNFTAGQVMRRMAENYPSLHSGPQSEANHIMCVIGGGGDWHQNGFVLYDPDTPEDIEPMEIPRFEGQTSWYPLCKYSALLRAAGLAGPVLRMNDSFIELAFNVAANIVEFGCPNGENDKLGRECLDGLAGLYPDKIPDYCKPLLG